ncbi:MAG: hypothetical protein QM500_17350, partial [Methylococcales bacterium]
LKGTVTITRVMHLALIPKSITIFAQVNKFAFLSLTSATQVRSGLRYALGLSMEVFMILVI